MHEQEQQAIVADLCAAHPVFARSTVERWVRDEADRYAGAKIQSFVPILVRRSVATRLRALDEIDLTGPRVPVLLQH